MDKMQKAEQQVISCCIERGSTVIRVIICDDNQDFLSILESHVSGCLKQLGISSKIHSYTGVGEIGGPILASCDIAVLDIDFNTTNYNGIDIARKLRSVREDAVVIFVTNYIEYAPEGYEVRAFRYILKKDIPQKLEKCIQQAVAYLDHNKEMFKIKVNGEVIDLDLKSILYIESQLRMVVIYVQKARGIKKYECYASITELEQQLEINGFLRVHKSLLVNMRHIKRYQCREIELDNGTFLKVSEKRYAEQKRKYLLWKGL